MSDPVGPLGSVSVTVKADLGPLDSGFAQARQKAQAFDQAVGQSLQNVARASQGAAASVGAVNKQFTAAVTSGASSWQQLSSQNMASYRALTANAAAAHRVTGIYGGLSFAAQNLSNQLGDVAQNLIAGQSPMEAAIQQGALLGQTFLTSGRGAGVQLARVGVAISGLLPPTALAIAGFGALGGSLLYLISSYLSGQTAITVALGGIGRVSGTTREQINGIAKETSNWTTTSTGAARELATEYARVGLVATDAISSAVNVTKDLAATLGTDSTEAAQLFAKALADPTKGVDLLNGKLAAWSDRSRSAVADFQAQGNYLAAQRLLIDGVASSTVKASEVTGFFAKSWDLVRTSTSNVVGGLSERLANLTGVGRTLEQQLATAREGLAVWEARLESGGRMVGVQQYRLAQYREEVGRLTAELDKNKQAAAEAASNLRSMAVAGAVRSAVPELGQRENLQRQLLTLEMQRGQLTGTSLSPQVAAEFDRSIARTRAQLDNIKSAAEKSTQASDIARQAAMARSPTEQANIAYQQKYIELLGHGVSAEEARAGAAAASSASLAAANYRLVEAQQARVTATRAAISETEADIRVIGRSVGQVELARSNQRTWNDLLREAEQNHLGLDWVRAQYNALVPLNQELAKVRQQQAELNLKNNLTNDRSDLFLSDSDRQITQQLRGVHGNDLTTAAAQADLAYARTTERIRQARDMAVGFTTTLAQGFAQGKTFTESLNSALLSVANTLIEMAAKQLITNAFGALLGGVGGGTGATRGMGGGGLLGGMLIPGILHDGGLAGSAPSSGRLLPSDIFANAPRFHSGKPAYLGPNEMPAIIDKREEVGYPDQLASKYGGGGGPREVNVSLAIDLTGANGDDTIKRITAETSVAAVRAGIEQFASRDLPLRLQEISVRGA
jgi:hypothetical protein